MSTPKFSIIIPIYNAENTIAKTINILKKFEYSNVEFLLVNDGSTDRTEKEIRKSIDNDSRFLLITKKNEGPGLARNYGIEQASGDYLLFFDADDFPKSSILEDYSSIISEHQKLDLIISSFIFRTLSKEEVADEKEYLVEDYVYDSNKEFLSDMYELMNKQLMYVVWNKCYRRDIIMDNNIRFKNYRSCEDRIFNLDYYKQCSLVIMNSKIEYVYEFNGGEGITNQYHEEKFSTFKEFYEQSNVITDNANKEGMSALLLKGTTSVIFSILETKEISKTQKKIEINNILKDSSILEARKNAATDTTIKKVTKLLFNMPTPIITMVLSTGAFIETKMPGVMAVLKRKY
ncbi:glycosyltransferase family 2 protein [Enterococcus raffinosus]|uniref:glycosyltransferase family 2 protein n=1 Tax=Enterococcus raffinosus TaxID=71452 RepID=UPI0007643AA0|nr:glycosyltransferase family A protein [Enterococcus raffinosus]OJG86644.1 glycosyl transferase family 2 [Enterococcus raffinosus]